MLMAQMLALLSGLLLSMVLFRAKAAGRMSLLPAVLYVSAVGVLPYLRVHWEPQLLSAVLLFFLYATRDMTDSHEPNDLVFFVTVMLCVSALWLPDALWCIIFLWIVVLLQGLFTLRTIVASILGIGMVTVYYVLAIYMGWAEPWDLSGLFPRHWIGNEQPACVVIALGVFLLGFLLAVFSAFQRSSYDLVSTRMLLYHVSLLGVLSSPLVIWCTAQPDGQVLLPISLSATTSIYLMQHESEERGVTLLLYLIGMLALYLWLLISL